MRKHTVSSLVAENPRNATRLQMVANENFNLMRRVLSVKSNLQN